MILHLTPIRKNLLDFDKSKTLLEIGGGCLHKKLLSKRRDYL